MDREFKDLGILKVAVKSGKWTITRNWNGSKAVLTRCEEDLQPRPELGNSLFQLKLAATKEVFDYGKNGKIAEINSVKFLCKKGFDEDDEFSIYGGVIDGEAMLSSNKDIKLKELYVSGDDSLVMLGYLYNAAADYFDGKNAQLEMFDGKTNQSKK